MRIDEFVENIVVKSDEFDSRRCSIDAEDMRYITSLLRNNYSDTILATIRETFANAVDANLENGKDASSIIVSVPTQIDSIFSIRDFGKGLSKKEMFDLYTKYGKSTKRGTNNAIGGFGIGRFAPLSYNKDGFTITSFQNREKRIYNIYVSEENDTNIDEIFFGSTDEADGILVSVNVSRGDINRFHNRCSDFFKFFEVLPTFKNFKYDLSKDEQPSLSGANWKVYSNFSGVCRAIIIGGIAYPLDLGQINLNDFNWLTGINYLHIYAPIGCVKLHHSRESLEYNSQTKAYLHQFLKTVAEEIKSQIERKFDNVDCFRKAKNISRSIRESVPFSLYSNIVPKIKVCGGLTIQSDFFNETRYQDANGLFSRIPVVIREFVKKDDFSLSHSRCHSLRPDDDIAYVFNDMPSRTKINCRIFSLFSQYKTVIVISQDLEATNQVDGIKLFKQQNHFDAVKTGVFHLSDLPETKMAKSPISRRVSYSPNYFSIFSGNYFDKRNLAFANQSIVNNETVIKPYVLTKDRAPIDKYFNTGTTLCRFSDQLNNLFNVQIYGVSTSIGKTKKFKNSSDFVPLNDFLQKLWNDFSSDEKQLFCQYASHDLLHFTDKEIVDFLIAASDYGLANNDFNSFLKNHGEICEKVKNSNLKDRFDFFVEVVRHSDIFAINYGDFSVELHFAADAISKTLKKSYPSYIYFIKFFDGLGTWQTEDRRKVLKDFINYAKVADFYTNQNCPKTP